VEDARERAMILKEEAEHAAQLLTRYHIAEPVE
jgi:hypothetical protein